MFLNDVSGTSSSVFAQHSWMQYHQWLFRYVNETLFCFAEKRNPNLPSEIIGRNLLIKHPICNFASHVYFSNPVVYLVWEVRMLKHASYQQQPLAESKSWLVCSGWECIIMWLACLKYIMIMQSVPYTKGSISNPICTSVLKNLTSFIDNLYINLTWWVLCYMDGW